MGAIAPIAPAHTIALIPIFKFSMHPQNGISVVFRISTILWSGPPDNQEEGSDETEYDYGFSMFDDDEDEFAGFGSVSEGG